jgi:hypothetical protein
VGPGAAGDWASGFWSEIDVDIEVTGFEMAEIETTSALSASPSATSRPPRIWKRRSTDLSTQAGDKLKSFIIDLRNNPGGLLDQAISISDAFLEKGEIVSTRGRTAEETLGNVRKCTSRRSRKYLAWPLSKEG